jgi:hypothetical protein
MSFIAPSGQGSSIILVVVCSFFGLSFLLKGVRNDILDASGMQKAPRWCYFVTGFALQLPAFIWTCFLRRSLP